MEIAVAVPRENSRVNVTGMIDRGQKLKLQEKSLQYPMKPEEFLDKALIPQNLKPILPRSYNWKALNIQTTSNKQNYRAGVQAWYYRNL